MKLKYLIIFSMLLIGCSDPIYRKQIEAFEKFCADKGGWVRLDASWGGNHDITCHDGTSVSLFRLEKK